jgi:hypothetical protein
LISTLVGGERSTSRPGRFTPGERAPGTHWIGGGLDLRAGLDDLEKRKFLTLPGLELPSRYTDYAIPAHNLIVYTENLKEPLMMANRGRNMYGMVWYLQGRVSPCT